MFNIGASWGSQWAQVVGTTTLSSGVWYHACVTYTGISPGSDLYGAAATLYLNGAIESSTIPINIAITTTTTNAIDFNISGRETDLQFGGYMDEVAVFDSVLTLAQVESIYNVGVPKDISDLSPIGWWRLGEGATFSTDWTIPDASTNSNTGTSDNMGVGDRKSDTP